MGDSRLRSGNLDRRVRLERGTETRDDFNGVVRTWREVCTVWGSKEDKSGSEAISAQELAAATTTIFVIRYSSKAAGVTASWRAVCEGVTYNITGVRELGRREGIELTTMRRSD